MTSPSRVLNNATYSNGHMRLKGQSTSNCTELVMATGGSDVVVTTGGNQEDEEKEQERGEEKVCTSLHQQ